MTHSNRSRWPRSLVALLATLLAAASLTPAVAFGQPDQPKAVTIRAVPRFPAAAQGGQFVIAVEMDHGQVYHSWPAKHVKLPDDVDEFAIRTFIGPPRDDDGRPVLAPFIAAYDGTQYPEAKMGKAPDPTGEKPFIEVPLYAKKAVSFARFKIKPDAPLGEQTLDIFVSYQACDDSICLMPEELKLPVKVKIVAAGAADLGAANEPDLFKTFDESQWGKAPAASPAPAKPETAESKAPDQSKSGAAAPAPTGTTGGNGNGNGPAIGGAKLFGLDLGSNFIVLFLASALGGFVLNLTPCVLPVIPIKVLTLNKHAGSKQRALVLGLWMAAGVVAFWAAIGIPMAFISKAIDPSQLIFGTWYITLGIGILIVLLSLGLMGLFTINLPQSVYAVETKADSPVGSFFFGVFTAILGLPCFGFVAGGLLAAAAVMPALTIMAIFVGMGVGMAAPYLVLSVYPQLLKFMPKTGPASNLVKQVMGLLLIAAGAFFVAAGIYALLKERPYLAGSMKWWAVGFFVAVASLWMVIRTWQIAKTTWPKLVTPVLAVIMTLGIGVFAQDTLDTDRSTYYARQKALGNGAVAAGDVPAGVWLEYTPELFKAVRATGRPIFLDFTADWCITCKALKAALLNGEALQSAFRKRDIVLMEVDCTTKSSAGTKFLTSLGRTGVPTWAIYAGDTPRFIPVDKPTASTVIAELDAAGITEKVAKAGR